MHCFVNTYLCQKVQGGESEEDTKVVLDNWLERNKRWVGNGRSVSTIVAEHMARTCMPIEQVEVEIDWGVINTPLSGNDDE